MGGTGTAGRMALWDTGGADITNSTLAKSGAGVLTLSASSAFTLTVPATGTAVLGTGSADGVAIWTGTNTVAASGHLFVDESSNRVGIGTLSPGKTLDVNGQAIIGGGLIVASLASGLTASAGEIHASDIITSDLGFRAGGNPTYAIGSWASAADAVSNGYIFINLGGTTYKIMTRA